MMKTRKINKFCVLGILLTLLAFYSLGMAKTTFAAAISNHRLPESVQEVGAFNPPLLVFTATPTGTPAAIPTETGMPTQTLPVSPTPISTDTPESGETSTATEPPSVVETSTPTPAQAATATEINPAIAQEVSGVVVAGKPVTVSILSGDSLIQTVSADVNGAFRLSVPPGSYTIVASAPGFLNVQGTVTVTASGATMPNTELTPGDLDGDNQINQLDLLTIGINYGKSSPLAADLNNDGVINVLDLQIISKNFPQSVPTGW
jgi:hypothetical protein